MKYKGKAIPKPSPGVDFTNEKSIVVPDQSMSLEEILRRFTRSESLPVGKKTEYGDESDNPLNVDLEKLAKSDITERHEYMDKLDEVQKQYNRQEKIKAEDLKKAEAERAKIAEQKRINLAAKRLAKENSKKLA